MELEHAVAKFLEERTNSCVPRIVEWYRSHLHTFVEWARRRGLCDLCAVQESDVQAFIADLRVRERFKRGGKLSPVTIRKRSAALVTFLKWAHGAGLCGENSLVRVSLPKAGRRLPKTLTPDQVRKLLSAPATARDRAILCLMLDTGLRLSEVAGLEMGDLDLTRGMIRVRHGKGDKERVVVFGDEAAAVLRAWLAERRGMEVAGDWVFVSSRGRLTASGVYQAIKDVADRVGLRKDVHPHKLRHTFATEYLDAGGSIADLSALLGHTDIRTTMVYVSVSLERLREKRNRLSLVNRLKGQ